jgi:hypothetical protein
MDAQALAITTQPRRAAMRYRARSCGRSPLPQAGLVLPAERALARLDADLCDVL